VNAPIVYFVDRSRDGQSFTNRRVTAIQHGEQIFHMAASFQLQQPGVEHHIAMPAVPPPETLPEEMLPSASLRRLPENMRRYFARERPFEFRRARSDADADAPAQCIWMRAIDRLPEDDSLHRCLLAYASDFNLLSTATLPDTEGELLVASIDHAMWFHRPLRVDDWHLYVLDSPSASQSRALVRGSLFSRDGLLVASTAQEGLMRVM
jgi:acyl-CoA thioesterase II